MLASLLVHQDTDVLLQTVHVSMKIEDMRIEISAAYLRTQVPLNNSLDRSIAEGALKLSG